MSVIPKKDRERELEKMFDMLATNVNERLEKLEALIGDPCFYKEDIGKNIDDINVRIKELEQKIENHLNTEHDLFAKYKYRIEDKLDEGLRVQVAHLVSENNNIKAVLKKMLEGFEETHDDSIHRSFFTGLLKQLAPTPRKGDEGEPSCKGCDYDLEEDCSEGCIKMKYEEEQEAKPFNPLLPFHDYTAEVAEIILLGKKEAEPEYGFYKNNPKIEAIKNKLIAEFLEKILTFNYAKPAEPQIIEIREWLEAKQRETEV